MNSECILLVLGQIYLYLLLSQNKSFLFSYTLRYDTAFIALIVKVYIVFILYDI